MKSYTRTKTDSLRSDINYGAFQNIPEPLSEYATTMVILTRFATAEASGGEKFG